MRNSHPTTPVVGVGGVIVKDDQAIIIKRANEPYQGQWSIPGGRVELGESLADALRREMREETGLEVTVGTLIDVFERIETDAAGVRYHFVIIDYVCTCVGGALCAGDDAVDVRWVTSAELEQYDIRQSAIDVIRRGMAMVRRQQPAASE